MASVRLFAGTGASHAPDSGAPWSNPTRVVANDDSYATASTESFTEGLRSDAFGFAVPAGATIDGIEVHIRGVASGSGIEDELVQLLKAATPEGDNKGLLTTSWATTEEERTYGGPTDLWGTTWTPANVNHADFGVTHRLDSNAGSARTMSIDSVEITVYYTGPVDVTPSTATLILVTFAPTVLTPRRATPTTAILTLVAFVPIVSAPRLAVPLALALVLTSFPPVVSVPRQVTPQTLALLLTAFAPLVTLGVRIVPATLALILTTFAPTIPGFVIISVTPDTFADAEVGVVIAGTGFGV